MLPPLRRVAAVGYEERDIPESVSSAPFPNNARHTARILCVCLSWELP
jgi:hypothetical protein